MKQDFLYPACSEYQENHTNPVNSAHDIHIYLESPGGGADGQSNKQKRRVIQARSAGFCFGVRRAVQLALQTAGEAPEGVNCWILGDLIHNRYVIQELAGQGIHKAEHPDEIPPGDIVIIRSHGEQKPILDALEKRRIHCVNATCPKVLHIQELAVQAEHEGRQVIILGQSGHPEVRGITSWCQTALVFENPELLQAWLENHPESHDLPITFLAQTTCIRNFFESSWKILKKQCTNAKRFDTICNATHERQTEAATLASEVDAMVVVGDCKSANTRHLTEICMMRCPRVIQIETADELSPDFLKDCSVAGLTAGASTPAGIIKEVCRTMSEEIKAVENTSEESFEELLEQSFKILNNGDRVMGRVIAITPTEVQVDVGAKQYAYIKLSELSEDPDARPEDLVSVGDEIEAWVVRVNDVEGYAELSKKRLDAQKVWESIEQAVEDRSIQDGVVTEENKGGIVVTVKGVRVFVPASQSGQPRGADLSKMVGQPVQLRITEANRARHRVVGSIRSVLDEIRRNAQAELWANIEVGKRYTGVIKSMTSYGVFVDIGGVDGMVHISELSWSRIKTPSEICKVGDTLNVYVISYDPDRRKISLGVKDRNIDPWQVFMDTYSVGDTANVRIVKLMNFGAFAEVVPGVDGLIHISQIAEQRTEHPEDVLSEGQMVDVKITAIDEEKRKISLSVRALAVEARRRAEQEAKEQAEAEAAEAAEETDEESTETVDAPEAPVEEIPAEETVEAPAEEAPAEEAVETPAEESADEKNAE